MSETMIHRETTGDGCGWELSRRQFHDEVMYDLCPVEQFTLYPAAHTMDASDYDSARATGGRKKDYKSIEYLDELAIRWAKATAEANDY